MLADKVMRGKLLVTGLCVLTLVATEVVADEEEEEEVDPKVAEAIEHFGNGVEFFNKKNYEAALVEFLESYELNPTWHLLYNIGICYDELGEPLQAFENLGAYLVEGGEEIPSNRAIEVKSLLGKLEKKVGHVELVLNVEDAHIEVDGEPVTWTGEPIPVNPGRLDLLIGKEGYEDHETEVNAVAGKTKTVHVDLVEIPVEPPEVEPPVETPEKKRNLSWAGFAIGAGSAGAFALIAGITGGLVLATQSDMLEAADDCDATMTNSDCPRAYNLQDKATNLKIASNVFWGLAGAAIVTGVVLLVTGKPDLNKEKERPEEEVDVTLAPILAPGAGGMYGLQLRMSF